MTYIYYILYLCTYIGVKCFSDATQGTENNNNKRYLSPSWIFALSWQRGLHNPMKLWDISHRRTKDKWDTGESFDKTWSTGGGNGRPLHYSCHENPMNIIKGKKDVTLRDEPFQVGRCPNATGGGWKAITNSSRKNEAAGPKRKWPLIVDVSGGKSNTWYCKEQYCTGTWNVRSLNQGKLHLVKQEMARVNINILGISELK